MKDKDFVQSICQTAHCVQYYSGWLNNKTVEYIIVAYPNTLWFGTSTKAKTPTLAWSKAGDILRQRFLRKLES
jgi:hypothetical protein